MPDATRDVSHDGKLDIVDALQRLRRHAESNGIDTRKYELLLYPVEYERQRRRLSSTPGFKADHADWFWLDGTRISIIPKVPMMDKDES